MIPQLLVKNKERMMDIRDNLLELEESARRISDGLSAIHVMVLGLDGVEDQYAGAFHAVWKYLSDAEQEFQRHLTACLNTI